MEVNTGLAVASREDVVALVPMCNVVLFAQILLPITVGRGRSLAALCGQVQPST
jgi:hypothetical protein